MATGRRRSGSILIVVAIILVVAIGAAAYLFRDQLFGSGGGGIGQQAQPTAVPPAVETIDIVILVQPVPLGGTITKDMVALFPYPKDKYVEGFYFKSINDVVGKRARYPLQPSIALTTGLLSSEAVGSFASSQIPPGYVAISVPIDMLSAVSWALQPGDHVSVLVALLVADIDPSYQTVLPNNAGVVQVPGTNKDGNVVLVPKTMQVAPPQIGRTEMDGTLSQPVYVQPSEAQRARIVSQVLISDATVLGVGDFAQIMKAANEPVTGPTPTPAPGTTPVTPTPVPTPDKITLVVSPQDAVTINYVMLNKGAKLNLVLRSAQDTKQVKTEAVTLQFLMDQYNIPLPSKLPYGLMPRVDSLNFLNSTDNSPGVIPPAAQATPAP
ncbi:MAG TPA: Flp pilus assembly protein CpaB [Anaerolineaceae bacterium]|nr:Flp pilus assembly protein CpaB [Anaerolineaceae bacterium]